MTITITLPPGEEERLKAEARATGKDVPTIVIEAVKIHLSLEEANLSEILAPIHAEFEKSGMTEAELDTFLQKELSDMRKERKSALDQSA